MNIPWGKILVGLFIAFMTFGMVSTITMYSGTVSWYRYLSTPMIVGVTATQFILMWFVRPKMLSLSRVMNWSIFKSSVNLNLIGVGVPLIGPLYATLLILILPFVVLIEEWVF